MIESIKQRFSFSILVIVPSVFFLMLFLFLNIYLEIRYMYIKGKERWTTLKKQVTKEEKKKKKEHKVIEKFVKKKDNSKQKYITKGVLKRKFKNAQSFTNAEVVNDNGIIKLSYNSIARVFSVDAIDLSLTSNNQKQNFLNQL